MKIKLNGKEIEVEDNLPVLDVARREGVNIPTLCYHEALGPYGACRLCVVEAEGPMLRRSLISSCTLIVSEGMSIETNTPLVNKSRKIIFELLLGRSPEAQPLIELAKKYGVENTRFGTGQSDDCVRCGLCVRVCRDKIGVSAISFAGRGQKRSVTAEFGKLSEVCIGCGACANICPTGAIRLEDRGDERKVFLWGNLISRQPLVKCGHCETPYTTERFLAHVRGHCDINALNVKQNLCPECSRSLCAEALTGTFPVS